eukprot:1065183-Pyramimonas_sp.AAC.1
MLGIARTMRCVVPALLARVQTSSEATCAKECGATRRHRHCCRRRSSARAQSDLEARLLDRGPLHTVV